MTSPTRPTSINRRPVHKLLIVTILLLVAIGGASVYATRILGNASPRIAQNREFYLFARDLHFGDNQVAVGLTSDYVYSSTQIVVNKGDTLTIHFYNPTDQAHSFTIGVPYSNDVTVQPADASSIQKADIVIVANQEGIFNFHCKFHPPQMIGNIIVQK